MAKIAIFGGSFNPPHLLHRLMAERLAADFDEVIVVPCGGRLDKPVVGEIREVHRAVMCELTFRGLPKVRVDTFDLENGDFTCCSDLQSRYSEQSAHEVWHVVGTDLIQLDDSGKSLIRRDWRSGEHIWQKFNWVVMERPGYPLTPTTELPPHHRVLHITDQVGSSTDIRERAFRRQSVDGLVTPEVAAYMERYGLYRGGSSNGITELQLTDPRPFIVVDRHNDEATAFAASLEPFAARTPEEANCILTLGGDGTMLRAIGRYWSYRKPFIGFNLGHVGYLLGELPSSSGDKADYLIRELVETKFHCHQLPLLHARYDTGDHVERSACAFNDFWVERSGHIAVVMDVEISQGAFERWESKRILGDGVLMSTAAGSTAYARNMGARPISVESPDAWLMIGSHVGDKLPQAPLGRESAVRVTLQDSDWRKGRLCGDADLIAPEVKWVLVRLSRVAAAELLFHPNADLASKSLRAALSR